MYLFVYFSFSFIRYLGKGLLGKVKKYLSAASSYQITTTYVKISIMIKMITYHIELISHATF